VINVTRSITTNKEIYLGVVGSVGNKFPSIDIAKEALFKSLDREVERLLKNRKDIRLVIISGASPKGGIDILVRKYSEVRDYGLLEFPPDFEKYGVPKAYYIRNEQIAKKSHRILGYLAPGQNPDRRARSGTMMTIRRGIRNDVTVKVFRLEGDEFVQKWVKWSWFEGWERHMKGQKEKVM